MVGSVTPVPARQRVGVGAGSSGAGSPLWCAGGSSPAGHLQEGEPQLACLPAQSGRPRGTTVPQQTPIFSSQSETLSLPHLSPPRWTRTQPRSLPSSPVPWTQHVVLSRHVPADVELMTLAKLLGKMNHFTPLLFYFNNDQCNGLDKRQRELEGSSGRKPNAGSSARL